MKSAYINKRLFHESSSGTYAVFDRNTVDNIMDIAGSAALAMHKAIIGICELYLLEQHGNGLFRQSKAVQTYYIIYHIFTCCMLLDPKYEIRFPTGKYGLDGINYGVPKDKLDGKDKNSFSPQEWNDRKFLEMDLATGIAHGDIKDYCNGNRSKKKQRIGIRSIVNNGNLKNLPSFVQVLYRHFIHESCDTILYEKCVYIRDRCIYRPTHVASTTDVPIQTSKDVRKQLDSLPSSDALFSIIREVQTEICKQSMNAPFSVYYFYATYFASVDVKYRAEDVVARGYSWEILEKMGGSKSGSSVPTFVCQLMELYSQEMCQSLYHKYWETIIEITRHHAFPSQHGNS